MTQIERDEFLTTIDVYTQTAARYATSWNGATQPRLDAFAGSLKPGASVLDAGCGTGRDLAAWRLRGFNAVGVDIVPAMLTAARATAHAAGVVDGPLLVGDLRDIPAASASFDAIWAYASLVHFNDDETTCALRELLRVCRPGGQLLSIVKHRTQGRLVSGTEGDRWFRWWLPAEFADVAHAAGWRVLSTHIDRDTVRDDVEWVVLHASR